MAGLVDLRQVFHEPGEANVKYAGAQVEIGGGGGHADGFEDRGLPAAVLAYEEVHAAELELKVVDRLEVLDR